MDLNKTVLIEYRISRSKETIEEARIAIENNQLFNAENRIYYAIYYIISALSLKNDFSTNKHAQLMGWFNKSYVKTKIISPEVGKIYFDAFEKRQKGDYEDLKTFEPEEVQVDFQSMLKFTEKIEKLIRT